MWISVRHAGAIARTFNCSNDDVGNGVRAGVIKCRGLTDGGGAYSNIEIEVASLIDWLLRVRAAARVAH